MSPALASAQGSPFPREFLRKAKRVPAALDPDEATAQTVQIMCEHIHRSAKDPLIQKCALDAVKQWKGGFQFATSGRDPFTSPEAIAESIWWWVKHSMTFVHHSKQIFRWLGEKDQLQLLIEPSVVVRMKDPEGDCAIYSMLICSMLEALGVQWELETLSTNPTAPEIYNHVFLRAVLPDGRRLDLDCSHGKYPGWRVPENNTLRSQVWDEDGNPIKDEAAYRGLHSYISNPNPWWLTGGGLGDDTTDPTSTDTSSTDTSTLPPMGPTVIPGTDPTSTSVSLDSVASTIGVDPSLLDSSASYNSSTGLVTQTVNGQQAYVAPSQSSAAWAAFSTAMVKAGVQLATIATIQPGTAILPNGTIVSVPAGQSLSSTFGNLFSGVNSSNVMMIGGLAIGALVLLSLVDHR